MLDKITATDDQYLLNEHQFGSLGVTAGVKDIFESNDDIRRYIQNCMVSHIKGNWGTVGKIQDTSITKDELEGGMFVTDVTAKLNLVSIINGDGSVTSHFKNDNALLPRLWIITELNDCTVLMLPSEY